MQQMTVLSGYGRPRRRAMSAPLGLASLQCLALLLSPALMGTAAGTRPLATETGSPEVTSCLCLLACSSGCLTR